MRLILPVLVLALAALASPGQTEPEWLGIRTDLERLSHQSAAAEPFGGSSQPDLSQDLDMRAFCGMGDEAFIAQLISQDCGDDGCAGRPAMVKRTIETLAAELDGLMTDARAGGELLFVPADSVFPRRPPESGEEVLYRAAADLWLRNSTDASTGDPSQRDRFFVSIRAWCGLIERNAAAAVSFTRLNGFPKDDTSQGRRQVAAIVYIAQHSAMNYPALSALRMEAEKTFRQAGLSPYYMAQILDVEREAYDGQQVVGHLTSCNETRAFFDPPLVDVRAADEWRAATGLPTSAAYLETTSRRCR
ncbi:MAG: hypothetical protein EON89_05845 [Brevundimonas sp.]|nr:MAG: hypothetical protein EON89_05845 [Brevundimonas sp.]